MDTKKFFLQISVHKRDRKIENFVFLPKKKKIYIERAYFHYYSTVIGIYKL